VAAFDEEGNLIFYSHAERLSPRWKTYGGNLDPITKTFIKFKPTGNDIITATAVGDRTLPELKEFDPTLVRKNNHVFDMLGAKVKPQYIIDHHLAHAYCAWCYRPDDRERLCVIFDGAGSSADGILKSSLVGNISNDGFRIIHDAFPILTSVPITNILGGNTAGKAMGLAGWKIDAPPFQWTVDNFCRLVESSINKDNNWFPQYPQFTRPLSEADMNFIAGFYKYITDIIWSHVKMNLDRYANGRGVVIGGGSTLALEINTKIHDHPAVKDVVFSPATNDSGLAIGAAAFSYFTVHKKWPKISTASIQALQKPLPAVGPQEPGEIAKLLSQNKVVALLRGYAEAGPRALGFRSIFAPPQHKENLERVSQKIKGREFYRPLAPIVTEEHFEFYFKGPKGKFMQYKVECNETAKECLPAIVHRDDSSRPQVVSKADDPWLHELLIRYGELTGHHCLINTSLNGPGKPICNTYDDAFADMNGRDVELVSLPHPATQL
jgi:predicted NodU family carbamoyl transferase